MDGHHVGALGDHRDAAVARARDAGRTAAADRGDHRRPRSARRSALGQAVGVELDRADAHRLQLHLGLPLVDVGEALGADLVQEALGAALDQPALRVDELCRAHALGAVRGDDQIAARRQDVHGRHHALDGLIVGLVERIAGSAGDHRLKRSATGTSA